MTQGEKRPNHHKEVTIPSTNQETAVGPPPWCSLALAGKPSTRSKGHRMVNYLSVLFIAFDNGSQKNKQTKIKNLLYRAELNQTASGKQDLNFFCLSTVFDSI